MSYSGRFYSHALTCQHCGETFHASRYDAKYCSGLCRSRAHRAAQKHRKLRATINNDIIDYLNDYEGDLQGYENAIADLIGLVARHSTLDDPQQKAGV